MFWQNKRVLVTGHTGFKRSWLSYALSQLGAQVTGYSLAPEMTPNLYSIADIANKTRSIIGDIRDREALKTTFKTVKPDIVFHLAAQPIVLTGYREPHLTYETNVMGTVNVLECIRESDSVRSFVNVTTDKVYVNKEWIWGYRENEPLDGFDPYSNSKSCSELVTHCYSRSFFSNSNGPAISTARAGNVIGGGDFAADRIIPDCVRALMRDDSLIIRNPNSIRPYQFVLEPLQAYMLIAEKTFVDKKMQGWYNIGPDYDDCVSTLDLVSLFGTAIKPLSLNVSVEQRTDSPHEAGVLKLDNAKIKTELNWRSMADINTAVRFTADWYREYLGEGNVADVMERQIKVYFKDLILHGGVNV